MCQSPLIVGPPWASPCRASVSPRGQVKSNQESTPFVLFPLTSQNQESVYGDLVRVRKIHIRHANSFYEDIRITGPCTGYFGPILLSRKRRRPRPNKWTGWMGAGRGSAGRTRPVQNRRRVTSCRYKNSLLSEICEAEEEEARISIRPWSLSTPSNGEFLIAFHELMFAVKLRALFQLSKQFHLVSLRFDSIVLIFQ